MSKSYGNYATVGICTGSNTEYYRDRRKHQRNVNKQRIRNTIANNDIEDFDDKFIPFEIPKKNDWDEPTDGTLKVKSDDFEKVKDYNLYIDKKHHKIKR
jgi:hypothetical protein